MSWDIPPPPNILLWAAIFGVALRLLAWLWGLWQRYSDRKQSIVDEFWYRTIILPVCWQPLIDLVSGYARRLQELDNGGPSGITAAHLRNVALDFGAEKNLLLGRFLLLTTFNEEIYSSIVDELDSLEDEITEYCESFDLDQDSANLAIGYLETLFWSKLSAICREMIKLHPQAQIPV